MKNPFESQESIPVSEQEVIDILDREEIDSAAALDLYKRYPEQCYAEGQKEYDTIPVDDKPKRAEVSARWQIICDVRTALAYAKSQKYRERGVERLNEAWENAHGRHDDLANDIVDTLEELGAL